MICEVLCVLAGHRSALFDNDAHVVADFVPLLHPGEVEILESLARLALQFVRIRDAANTFRSSYNTNILSESSSSTSEYISTLGNAIHTVLLDYEDLIVSTESRILQRDDELVGGHAFVPLSSIKAVFSVWEAPMVALDGLIDVVYGGPHAKANNDVSKTRKKGQPPHWPPGRLIDLLLLRAENGIQRVSQIMTELACALQRLCMIHLTTFMLHGSLAALQPLATDQIDSSSMSIRGISSLVLQEDMVPSCITAETRESIVYVGKAVAIMGSQGNVQAQLPRRMIVQFAAMLSGVLPQDGFAFDRVIGEIRKSISEFLWAHVLKDNDVIEAVEFLANFFLLRNGEFAVALIIEIERLKLTRLKAAKARSTGIREQDLSLALLRASLGTDAEHDPSLNKIRFHLPLGSIRPFLPPQPISRPGTAVSEFADYLLGTPLVLNYDLEWPLNLFLVPADLQVYSHLFAYFSAIRRAQHVTLQCWASLSNSQRSRRKFTGSTEGGTLDSVARTRLLRCGWGLLRQMLWFLDTLWSYLMNDVVGTQYQTLLRTLRGSQRHDDAISKPAHSSKPSVEGMQHPKQRRPSAGTKGEESPKSHLDFSTLRAYHSHYLKTLLTGSLLTNPSCSSVIRRILSCCDEFVALIERWGGDVLPELLSEGSLSEDSEIGEKVREREAVVKEMNETLNEHLRAFYESLSESMSFGKVGIGGGDASMLLNTSAAILGLNSYVPQARGSMEREGLAMRHVEHLLLRLDFNSALSAPPERPNSESVLAGLTV